MNSVCAQLQEEVVELKKNFSDVVNKKNFIILSLKNELGAQNESLSKLAIAAEEQMKTIDTLSSLNKQQQDHIENISANLYQIGVDKIKKEIELHMVESRVKELEENKKQSNIETHSDENNENISIKIEPTVLFEQNENETGDYEFKLEVEETTVQEFLDEKPVSKISSKNQTIKLQIQNETEEIRDTPKKRHVVTKNFLICKKKKDAIIFRKRHFCKFSKSSPCIGCENPECGKCDPCKDKKERGGKGTLKQKCIKRACKIGSSKDSRGKKRKHIDDFV